MKAKKITSENFSEFGKVVVGTSGEPTSQAVDYKFWSDIINYHIDGETEIGICTVYKHPDVEINGMERHLKTPEVLIPIDAPFVLPLLSDKDNSETADAFIVEIGQAVLINEKVWHGACIPFDKDQCSYFVIFKKGTPHNDVEIIDLPKIIVEI